MLVTFVTGALLTRYFISYEFIETNLLKRRFRRIQVI